MTVEDENSEAVKRIAERVWEKIEHGENFNTAFTTEFHFSDFPTEVRINVRAGVKRFHRKWRLEQQARRQTQLLGAWGAARQTKEHIAPLH